MVWLIYNTEFWFSLMIILITLEMLLDGSMIFLLPTGVGAGMTGLSLYSCKLGSGGTENGYDSKALASFNKLDIACGFYDEWQMLIVSTAVFSLVAFFIIKKILGNKENTPDINDY